MNLNAVVSGPIGAINPNVPVTVQFSTGATKTPDGRRTPNYGPSVTLLGQVQSLSYDDLQHLDGQNIQGIRRAIYLNGDIEAIRRLKAEGEDIVTLADGTVYKTALVIERWDGPTVGWCKVAATWVRGP